MDRGIVSKLKIKCLSLEYSKEDRKQVKNLDYQKEIEYIVSHSKRNRYIVDLALEQNKNTLVLFNYLKHGDELVALVKEVKPKDKQIFIIRGDVNANEREIIRHSMETNNNIILFATYRHFICGCQY